jgi:soluble lytic murein transglycosylase-like protein
MKWYLHIALGAGLLAVNVYSVAADLAVLRNGFEIRHERREQVGGNTRLYLDRSGPSYVDIPTEQIASFEHDSTPASAAKQSPQTSSVPAASRSKHSAQEIQQVVSAASDRHQVDPDLIASVIRAESNYNSHAVSPKGAQGLMQLMPGTASKLGVTNALQPDANVDAGTRYLRELLVRYNDDVVKALAAYNAGPQRVEQYHGVPPYRETQAYVARIVRDFNRKKAAQSKNHSKNSKKYTADIRSRHERQQDESADSSNR